MGFVDALLHLANLIGPALAMGAVAASLAKWVWRRELAAVPWRRLAQWACVAAVAASVGGLIVTGRDGRMVTYGAMVLAVALALWVAGFGPMRRR